MSDDTKRGTYGDGTIRTRKDGLLEKRISLGYGPDGRRRRISVYAPTKRELQAKARQAIRKFNASNPAPGQETVHTFFTREEDGWLDLKERELALRTIQNYRNDYERYIEPHLGNVRLDPERLTVELVTRWHATLAKKHGAYTANRARDLLANALMDSPDLRVVNPAKLVRAAKHHKKPIEILTSRELDLFVPALARTRLQNMILLALLTGIRHGEATALHWSDVTLLENPAPGEDHGEIRIRRSVITTDDGPTIAPVPKSDAGRRTIGLTPEAAAALRRQKEVLAIEGQAYSRLVFPNSRGNLQPLENTGRALRGVIDACNPRLVEWMSARREQLRARGYGMLKARQQAWQDAQALPHFQDLLDVKYVSFHDLRHTFASMMIAAGITAPELAVLLGHSDPAFTMRTYVHEFERQQRRPMPRLSSLAPGLREIGGKIGGSNPEVSEEQEEARPDMLS